LKEVATELASLIIMIIIMIINEMMMMPIALQCATVVHAVHTTGNTKTHYGLIFVLVAISFYIQIAHSLPTAHFIVG